MKKFAAIGLALCLATAAGCGGGSSAGSAPQSPPPITRDFSMGFTTWPYDATVEAVTFVNTEISARGDFVAHHLDGGIPWQEAFAGTAYNAAVEAEIQGRLNSTAASQRMYLAISPFNTGRDNLAGNWGAATNEPLQAPWSERDFDSPEVITAYTNFARDMITRFQPAYFNLGIEASELLVNDQARFDRFVTFATQVSATLRNEFPNLRLMTSVALKSPGSSRAQTIETNIGPLIDLIDVVGISVYPYVFFDHADKGNPDNLPSDWFSQIRGIAGNKPVAVAETAWIAERMDIPTFNVDVSSTAQHQANYMVELFAEADALDAEFIVWWALVDFDALWSGALAEDPVARIWRDTGLFDEALNSRPALDIWQQQFALPR